MWSNAGLCGVGVYLPGYRIGVETLAKAWKTPIASEASKSVANDDEDATTMAVEAARAAVGDADVPPDRLDTVWVGSESKPYAVSTISATVAEAIGATPWVGAADLEFACRGPVEGLKALATQYVDGRESYCLLVATDVAQGRPGDELERTAAAGAVAFVLGPTKKASVLLSDTVTRVTDTPDFYRRDGSAFPTHTYRFTGQPAYFDHVLESIREFFRRHDVGPKDFRFIVLHQPTSRFARKAASAAGFTSRQVEPVMLAERIGNPYAANTLLALAYALDQIESGDQVLVACYGSGAGADCFAITATAAYENSKGRLSDFLRHYVSLDGYGDYLQMTRQTGGGPAKC